MKRIASFSVDHDWICPGLYLSRVDGDITTYDLRTRWPNRDDYMDHSTMHTLEHMMATMLRNGPLSDQVIYFGPMGCQTGFYLLIRDAVHSEVIDEVRRTLRETIAYDGLVPGSSRKECGNYRSLNLDLAKAECERYLSAIENATESTLVYPTEQKEEA